MLPTAIIQYQYQHRLALNLTLDMRLVFAAPPTYEHRLSPLGISFHSRQEAHGHPHSRYFGSKRPVWIKTCFRTTSGERKPYCAKLGIDIVAANIDRTIDIPSTQETYRKTARRCLQSQG